ncbi:MAG: permease, partial [Chloroflexota bacterium]
MAANLTIRTNDPDRRRLEYVRGFVLLFVVAVAGLFVVKWQPYYLRTLTILSKHAYPGSSMVSGTGVAAPAVSVAAALSYFRAYVLAIWQALVLALVLAATIEALVPRDWIARVLGRVSAGTALLAGLLALPSMMCTCCTAPVVVGLRKSSASAGAAATYFVGNPTLNPAVLVFLLLTLGWRWAALRLVLGVALVAAAGFAATRLAGTALVLKQPELDVSLPADGATVAVRWLRSLGRLAVTLLPEYLVIVLLLGALRSILFPAQI